MMGREKITKRGLEAAMKEIDKDDSGAKKRHLFLSAFPMFVLSLSWQNDRFYKQMAQTCRFSQAISILRSLSRGISTRTRRIRCEKEKTLLVLPCLFCSLFFNVLLIGEKSRASAKTGLGQT
jgi:hypothetical protein